jgi:hypothetical protein
MRILPTLNGHFECSYSLEILLLEEFTREFDNFTLGKVHCWVDKFTFHKVKEFTREIEKFF